MGLNYLYFDNAATTPVDPLVIEAMLPYLREQYGNPSASHGPGRMARLAVETARKKIAGILHCRPQCIIFTSGGTESANTALRAAVAGARVSQLLTARTEHACVLQTARQLHFRGQVSLQYVATDAHGVVQPDSLEQALQHSQVPALVALMHANNETGAPLNLPAATDICRKHQAIFFSDTVQTIGHYPFDLSRGGPDLISASAHKFHGPKGVGFLYVREGLPMHAILTGGAQEAGLRAGTENVASIVGMATALELASERFLSDALHIRLLRETLKEKLLRLGATINGPDTTDSLYTVLNARFPKSAATEALLLELDMAGVAVSGGSACNAAKGSSHVMEAIGAADAVNIRFSFSRYNTQEQVTRVGALLESLLAPETIHS